ncbi:hypothetical protein BG53_06685 [Paenibacillus darwinianus]|uniref:DUF1934 domain-containing protein n=1 Tax=Paenibacillus darwinianus TaxID=1380763 RepID=A0A9W5W6B9_9BACL|nr:DUF1934 domain-containing protein [Paenibacillus darwinianus]EXX85992.1 hypothetical protein CH50_08215 [Paenibacillus darwinianus]EXX86265.1 hypothetical protein BG53_06685 [Paenibacillus darwinianus]EXX86900.1 hypothetical protein BG52_05485 [Paenibacillus darwinianus]
MNNDPVPVRVTLESRQDGGKSERHEYRGTFYRKPNAFYLRYEDQADTAAYVGTTVRWDGRELRIVRRGAVEGEQSFAAGCVTTGRYRSQAADLELETKTTVMKADPGDWTGGDFPLRLRWAYKLKVNGQSAGRFEIKLSLREEQSE